MKEVQNRNIEKKTEYYCLSSSIHYYYRLIEEKLYSMMHIENIYSIKYLSYIKLVKSLRK